LGSSLSLRSFARVGSSLSLRSSALVGSSLSLRSFARVGSSVSVSGLTRFGSVFSMSVLDFLHLGSSLSLRSFARFGSSLSVKGTLGLGGDRAYFRYDSNAIEAYVGGVKGLDITSSGGNLYGAWASENIVQTSDRRLKTDIQDLGETLGKSEEGVTWILRELRPVQYRFRRGSESKETRYGFIADEVGGVLPALLRSVGDSGLGVDGDPDSQAAAAARPNFLGDNVPAQGVVVSDLIALLVAQAKAHQTRLEQLAASVARLDGLAAAQAEEIRALREEVRDLRPLRREVGALRQEVLTIRRPDR
jgi:hypothetical protein